LFARDAGKNAARPLARARWRREKPAGHCSRATGSRAPFSPLFARDDRASTPAAIVTATMTPRDPRARRVATPRAHYIYHPFTS
jgi:hypothetical protein